MDFTMYINARIPNFDRKLSMRDIEELKQLFDSYSFWKDTEEKILKLSLSMPLLQGYICDFERASSCKMKEERLLNEAIIQKLACLQDLEKTFKQK